ncbi:related to phosphatidylinositol/phosphatidylcholine transfer protein [Cephalotrichum gorgonifer]|uniref:Related to phosphatidylinositol/phosphatidylcholine transfer protein n=1 Tax=Cephalotrichum gorgonifer TaxID=2041049 RepID=A0AAE8MRR2_9PEZI|nr:related to phosphatidylinositol/phosphatidylcholine transfer protein [Cephalotrichum gorgonifer]
MATNSGASDPAPSTADSSPGADHGYPHGHAGYLDEQQVEALTEFKRLAEEAGLYTRGPPGSIDDAALLRYLRARRWVPADALQQLADTSEWRQANDIDILYNTIEVTSYEQSRRMYPQWTGRRDRRGIPLYLFVIKQLDNKSVADYERLGAEATFSRASPENRTSAPGLLRLFALYENLTHFVMPFCTQLEDREFPDAPITMTTNIVDISGVGLKQFWNLKAHMQAASQLATAHYPETLDRIFIIGAPMFFSTVWGWIKRWFDPITVSKIFILSGSEVESTLRQFIDPSNIPKKYGGDLDFSWGDLPTVDPAWDGLVEWAGDKKGFPTGPHVWRDIEGGARMECVGLGQRDGVLREERICVVKKTYFGDVANAAKDRAAAAGEGATGGVAAANEEAKLSDGVAKLDIAQDEADEKSAVEVNGKEASESVSPPLPTTVA